MSTINEALQKHAGSIAIDTTDATSTELRDLARVVKASLCLLLQFWNFAADRYPPQHPYRQSVLMILRYLERRYDV